MIEFTEAQKKKYLDNPNRCPNCDSDDIDSFYSEKDDNWVACRVYCNECNEEWHDIYTLADVSS